MADCNENIVNECDKVDKSFFQKINEIWTKLCNVACQFSVDDINDDDSIIGIVARVEGSQSNCRTQLVLPPPPESGKISVDAVVLVGPQIDPFVNPLGAQNTPIVELTETVTNNTQYKMLVTCFCRAGHWVTNYKEISPGQNWVIDYILPGDSPQIELSSGVGASGGTPVISYDSIVLQPGEDITFDCIMYLQSDNYVSDLAHTIDSNFVYFDITKSYFL